MNFVFVIGINHLSCKISDALFHDKAVNLLTIVCTLHFTAVVFILFAYGLTPGFSFSARVLQSASIYRAPARPAPAAVQAPAFSTLEEMERGMIGQAMARYAGEPDRGGAAAGHHGHSGKISL